MSNRDSDSQYNHAVQHYSDSRLRLTGTIVALAGARVQLKFRSETSNAFSHGDQNMSTSDVRGTSGGRPPHAGDTAPAVELTRSSSQSGNCVKS